MSAIVVGRVLMATPFERGSEALLQHDWQSAVDACTEAIEAEPSAEAYITDASSTDGWGGPGRS